MSHSSKLWSPRRGFWEPQVITDESELQATTWDFVIGVWSGIVSWDWTLNFWDLVLTTDRLCQNWSKVQDTQLVSQTVAWCVENTHIWGQRYGECLSKGETEEEYFPLHKTKKSFLKNEEKALLSILVYEMVGSESRKGNETIPWLSFKKKNLTYELYFLQITGNPKLGNFVLNAFSSE